MTIFFEALKQMLTTLPPLELPEFTNPFVVETDAPSVALEQKKVDDEICPV